ncbi:TraG/TraD/VirD4 family protein [Ruminococcaceae bacterium OttesenSCG-928-I18]|nr:TraG/TraD/VirD4 family protein [Ruminococcaceae bacterium OttesenSCG-928-I18]
MIPINGRSQLKRTKTSAGIRAIKIPKLLVDFFPHIYKDNADTIVGNMDTTLFLGGKEKTTLEEISKMLGKETVDMYNTSVTKGNQESHGQNFQKLGRELMSVDEIAVMDGAKCILQVRDERPFLSSKYDITKHPNYRYLADSNKKNLFDIEKYLSTKLKLKPNDAFEVIEIDLIPCAKVYLSLLLMGRHLIFPIPSKGVFLSAAFLVSPLS